MASILPNQSDPSSPIRPAKILTAGFNSPVPECTLQVASQFTNSKRQKFATAQPMNPPAPLVPRTWFDRLLQIF